MSKLKHYLIFASITFSIISLIVIIGLIIAYVVIEDPNIKTSSSSDVRRCTAIMTGEKIYSEEKFCGDDTCVYKYYSATGQYLGEQELWFGIKTIWDHTIPKVDMNKCVEVDEDELRCLRFPEECTFVSRLKKKWSNK